jgi:hypothetical protein
MLSRSLSVAAALTLLACASGSGRSAEGTPHPVDIEVRNNLLVPTDLTVYAVRSTGGGAMLLGSILPAKTQTLRFTPSAYTDSYRLYARLPNGRAIRSESFIVGSDMTGTIVWTLVPNILGFFETDSTTVAMPNP